ncbi:MAG: enoyl-CoA hydratase/isomerase family protein [Alphaproteobacteria bacterium]|nr:enoyl-CoA hydratase/isomerase family protein [Alphaproteobacteria bacterium]
MRDAVFETLELRLEPPLAIATLNRPERLNAINRLMKREIARVWDIVAGDADLRVLVLHGAGRAFSPGFDLKEAAARDLFGPGQVWSALRESFDFIMRFWDSPKPSVAAIHGYCLAGAFDMALACDMTVAADDTRLGIPEVRFGASIGCLLLPWFVGPKAAKELLLTGSDALTAPRAQALGIVNRVVPRDRLLPAAIELARAAAAVNDNALALTRRAVQRSLEARKLRQALDAAFDTATLVSATGGPERAEFFRISKEKGLQAAIAWRDRRFARGAEGA